MNLKNPLKVLAVVGFCSAVSHVIEKFAPRPVAENPTTKRVGAVIVGVLALNYGAAAMERKLGLTETNSKFPFKD